jgi:general secretion pathway protein D
MHLLQSGFGWARKGAVGNRRRVAMLMMAAMALSRPVSADRAGDAYKHGVKSQRQENYDAAYAYYKQAYLSAPNNAKYFAAYTRMRFDASTKHLQAGQFLRAAGSLTEAMAEFQRAVEIDSTSFIAQQEQRRTVDMLRRQERQRSAPKAEAPPSKLGDGLGQSVELRPLSNAAITLHLTADAALAYRTICKLAGINVLIDPDYRSQKMSFELNDVTLREALDMVRLQSKTFWRPVSSNTIFVTSDSPGKRKELEQNVMRTFYLRNLATPAELQEAANVVRQILDVSRVQLLQAQDALVVRGTPDQMVLAEKLLADIDKPKSEVVIDVAVMQVSRDRIRNFGTTVPTSTSIGYLGTDSGSGSGGGGGHVVTIGNFAVSVPGAAFTALASDSNAKILQHPQIRALNDEKATLRIGDRVPIATGSFQPGVIGAGGVSPLVSTQFQYLDVGVNIDIVPHIHEHEVTLKMALEISSVTGSQTIGGITQPVIGQRRIEHETRLADGDVNLLGGILEASETQSLSGYPWISKLPILKYLFAQEDKERRENEIIFAITPHIVRSQEITQDNLRAVEVGTGSSIELHRSPSPERAAESPRPSQAAPQASPAPAPDAPASGPGSPSPIAPSQAGQQRLAAPPH